MVEAAIRGEPNFVADDRELKRPGLSYTVDTLTCFRGESRRRSAVVSCCSAWMRSSGCRSGIAGASCSISPMWSSRTGPVGRRRVSACWAIGCRRAVRRAAAELAARPGGLRACSARDPARDLVDRFARHAACRSRSEVPRARWSASDHSRNGVFMPNPFRKKPTRQKVQQDAASPPKKSAQRSARERDKPKKRRRASKRSSRGRSTISKPWTCIRSTCVT